MPLLRSAWHISSPVFLGICISKIIRSQSSPNAAAKPASPSSLSRPNNASKTFMMQKISILCSLLLASFYSLAQNTTISAEYIQAVRIGFGELQKEQCSPCLEAYDRAFALSQHSVLSHLRAARCAQMCGQIPQAKILADKALSIQPSALIQILKNKTQYPELQALANSKLGKNLIKKAQNLDKTGTAQNTSIPE